MDNLAPPALLEIAKTDKKDVFLISTEASFGEAIFHECTLDK